MVVIFKTRVNVKALLVNSSYIFYPTFNRLLLCVQDWTKPDVKQQKKMENIP